jgi:ERCC4-type nuclease
LDKKSETLKILQRVRDEAHRFGVKHHRTRRTNNTIKSELEEIPGVGEKTIELLLKKLKSVKRVKEANLETLEEILGKSKAREIWDFLIHSINFLILFFLFRKKLLFKIPSLVGISITRFPFSSNLK